MATRKRLLDVAQSELEIDLERLNSYTERKRDRDHFNTGQTLTVRENPKVICKPTAAITLLAHQVSRRSLRRS